MRPPLGPGASDHARARVRGRVVAASDERAWPTETRVTADGACAAASATRAWGATQPLRYGGSLGLHADGAFALRVVVPEYCLIALPDAVPDVHGALAEPLAVGLHALGRGGAGAGTTGARARLRPHRSGDRTRRPCHRLHSSRRRARRGSPGVRRGAGVRHAQRRRRPAAPGTPRPRRRRRRCRRRDDGRACAAPGCHRVRAPRREHCARRITSAPVELDTSRLVLFERSLVEASATASR